MNGKSILFEQLETLKEGGKTQDAVKSNTPSNELLEMFEIPAKYTGAFFAYFNEYINGYINQNGAKIEVCDILDSPFHDCDEPLNGVRERLLFFFEPILNLIPVQQSGIILKTHVDPSFEDTSTLFIIADTFGKKRTPAMIYMNNRLKHIHPIISSVQNLYKELEEIYDKIYKNCCNQISQEDAV